MWIFNCDRCHKEDVDDKEGRRKNGAYAATITARLKMANNIDNHTDRFDLCTECWENLEWWMQKLDVIIPNQTMRPITEDIEKLEP